MTGRTNGLEKVKGHGPGKAADANSNNTAHQHRLRIYIVLSKTRAHLYLLPPAKKLNNHYNHVQCWSLFVVCSAREKYM